jgi:hypothetical protein
VPCSIMWSARLVFISNSCVWMWGRLFGLEHIIIIHIPACMHRRWMHDDDDARTRKLSPQHNTPQKKEAASMATQFDPMHSPMCISSQPARPVARFRSRAQSESQSHTHLSRHRIASLILPPPPVITIPQSHQTDKASEYMAARGCTAPRQGPPLLLVVVMVVLLLGVAVRAERGARVVEGFGLVERYAKAAGLGVCVVAVWRIRWVLLAVMAVGSLRMCACVREYVCVSAAPPNSPHQHGQCPTHIAWSPVGARNHPINHQATVASHQHHHLRHAHHHHHHSMQQAVGLLLAGELFKPGALEKHR